MVALSLIQPLVWSLLATSQVSHPHPPTVSGAGALDPGRILQVLTMHQAVLEACFQLDAQRGAEGGRLVMSWQILAGGSVAGVRVVEAPANVQAGWCIARQMSRWSFPPPSGGPVSVRHLMVLRQAGPPRPGNDLLSDRRLLHADPPAWPAPPRRERCWVMKGALDTSALSAAIDRQSAKLARCLELAAHRSDPKPAPVRSDAGVLAQLVERLSAIHDPPAQIELTLSATGALQGLSLSGGDRQAEACLRAEVATWSLPQGPGDAVVGCELWAMPGTGITSSGCRSGSRLVGFGCQTGDGKEGAFGRWASDGAPIELGAFLHGQRHGTWTTWHPSRSGEPPVRRQVERWSEGRLDGEWEAWNPAGVRIAAGAWERGKEVGTWRQWHANGALQSVTEHAQPGVVASVTRYDELGELALADTYAGGRLEKTARFASGEPVPSGAEAPPMCRQLDVQPLPPPRFPDAYRLVFEGFVGETLVFIAASPTALEARVYLAGEGRWAVASAGPAPGTPTATLNARPLEGGQLFVWSDSPPMAHVIDVPGLAWRSLAAPPGEARVKAVGHRCAYAWPQLHEELLLQRGFRWCLGDGGWSALPVPDAFALTERLVTIGDDLFAVTSIDAPSAPLPRPRPTRWRGATYESASGAWHTVEIPGLFAQPLLRSSGREAVLVDLASRGPHDARGGTSGRPPGAWQPFTIPSFQEATFEPASPSATEVVLVRPSSGTTRLLFDGARRRWSAVPEGASSWPHFLWAGGRLEAMDDGRSIPAPRFSVLDWASRSWCEVLLGHGSLEAPPRFDPKGRPLPKPSSTFGLFVGDGAAAIWGRDDVTPLPCDAVRCSTPPTVKQHVDVGVIARWPVPRPSPR